MGKGHRVPGDNGDLVVLVPLRKIFRAICQGDMLKVQSHLASGRVADKIVAGKLCHGFALPKAVPGMKGDKGSALLHIAFEVPGHDLGYALLEPWLMVAAVDAVPLAYHHHVEFAQILRRENVLRGTATGHVKLAL